jgi:hypothetical protein
MRAGFAICQAIGPGVAQIEFLLAYSDGSLRLGETREGVRAADEAIALVARYDERGVEAELHRLRGELLLQREATADSPASPDGMVALERALEIARQQSALGLELRAAIGLSRCWYRTGREEDGRRLLVGICERFKEGAQTADLKAAHALLAGSESVERGRRSGVSPRRRGRSRAGSR